jgi:hypothetical protein
MSETQLRDAFALMKQGNKREALQLVQEVLRQDRSNVYAWWLLSHLIDDEEKIVKSLEKVLSLNPEHPGARKRLAELRPEYSHLMQSASAEKVKNTDPNGDPSAQYWSRLNSQRPVQRKGTSTRDKMLVWIGLGSIVFLVLAAFVLFSGIGTFFAEAIPEENDILARMDNYPESVAQAYFEALFREDVEALTEITCSDFKPRLDELLEDFEDLRPDLVSVDFTATRFEIEDLRTKAASVMISGSTTINRGGSSYTIRWEDMAADEGYDFYAVDLREINETWLICD